MRRLIVSVLFLFMALVAKPQLPGNCFTNYTVANGLAYNSVNCILQDSRGFMWFGTGEGLSRFDGTNFKNYFAGKNDSTALTGNSINYLIEIKPGELLFTADQGLTVFNTICRRFHQPKLFLNKHVGCVSVAENNQFFIGRSDTCFIMNREEEIIDTLLPPFQQKGQLVHAFILDDTTWLTGTQREYFIYHTRQKKYKPFLFTTSLPAEQRIFLFHYYDKNSRQLYFSNFWSGLYKYSVTGRLLEQWRENNSARGLLNGNLTFITPKKDGLLWIGSYGGGLQILNTRTGMVEKVVNDKMAPRSLPSNKVVMNYTDPFKNEWLATTNGVTKLNAATAVVKSWQTEFGQLSGDINLLDIKKGTDGNVYVSAFNRSHSYRINKVTGQVTLLNPSRLPAGWCLNNFGNDLIFTGAGTAITTFNPATDQYRQSRFLAKYFPTADLVVLAFKHSNGDEWYSGNNGGGFVRVEAKNRAVHCYKKDGPNGKFSLSYYSCYAEDKKGDLWFGVNKTENLLHWNKQTDRFTEIILGSVNGMPRKPLTGISDIIIDRNDNLWIALDGAGLVRYHIHTNTAEQYTIQNGLLTNYTYSLQFDNRNRLWIGTTKGLSCFLVDQNRFINFSKNDGLPDDYFDETCLLFDSAANKLWAGTTATLMCFDPDVLLRVDRKPLPVYIDEITVNGVSYDQHNLNNIQFRPWQNNLQFRFIGVDIDKGKDIEYSYKLTGADGNWVYNTNIATASYANLTYGNYIFMVKARHKGDTEWTFMQHPVTFTIQRHWWQKWWFRTLLFLALLQAVVLIVAGYYRRRMKKQKAMLEKQQAIEKERTRIASDMHDDFGASLSRIKFLSEKLQWQESGPGPLRHDLEKISAYSDEMTEKMGEIVWALNQCYDSSGDLAAFCRSYASEYLGHHGLPLVFNNQMPDDVKIGGEERRNVFLCMKEALHNITKHAGAGSVEISFTCSKGALVVSIHDDGKGMDTNATRPFANGLKNMRKRMEDIGGQLSIVNEKGTTIVLTAPLLL